MLDHLACTHAQFGNSVVAADITVDTDSTQVCGFLYLYIMTS